MSTDPQHRRHTCYALECPTCRLVVESCGCSLAPRYPARLPCKSCSGKIGVEFHKDHGQRPRSRWKFSHGHPITKATK